MTDSGKRPLHLGCGEGLCSYLAPRRENPGDMSATDAPRQRASDPGKRVPESSATATRTEKERS